MTDAGKEALIMKALLVGMNSKYIHSNPAVYSLKAYAQKQIPDAEIDIAEYTINQPLYKIMADICSRDFHTLFFSCYIWNIRQVEELIRDIAQISPETDIWLGGPEVSFHAEEMMRRMPVVKGIMRGEGEVAFFRVICAENDDMLAAVDGITFRDERGTVISTPDAAPLQLDSLPFPSLSTALFRDRIVYYESSRGCPFRCAYCLSSVDKSLRFKSLSKVEEELYVFLKQGVPQVKFVDRTFNCDRHRAASIWRFIRDHDNGITNFHFEIAGDLLTDEDMEILGGMRPGHVQLEIGVQTINERTLNEIERSMDAEQLAWAVKQIRSRGNVHLHLDLIAGLPYEDMKCFQRSFNTVYGMKPHQLQLGFLKILKGSPMEKRSDAYGMKYGNGAPYEILETKWISYEELVRLKLVEEMVDVYHNSGRFTRVLDVLESAFDGSFQMFEELALWYRRQGLDMLNISRNGRYENLLRFGQEWLDSLGVRRISEDDLMDAMIVDFYAGDNVKTRPTFLRENDLDKEFVKEFYSMEARSHRYLTGPECMATSDPRHLRKISHLERMGDRILLFDYTKKDLLTGNAQLVLIPAGDRADMLFS